MIGYATLGTNDIDKALAFYDALLGALGARQLMTLPDARSFTLYGAGPGKPMLAITKPYDGGTATPGNGAMVALLVDDTATVDTAHAKALELGGTDEGAPGPRGPVEMGLYGGYVRDLDGNKLFFYRQGG